VDPKEVHALTGTEARRIAQAQRAIRAAVIVALRETRNPAMIADAKLRTIDRIMQRWAVGHGTGLPPEDEDKLRTRPPPLDPGTQNVIDDIVKTAMDALRRFIGQWYRTEVPCKVMAAERGMSIRSLYRKWEVVLEWLREMFLAAEHPDLTRMVLMVGD
jgi:hypothetical protein